MSSVIVRSVSADQRLRYVVGWLRERPAAEEVLVIGASAEAAAEIVRVAASGGPGPSAVFGWRRITLGGLAAELAAAELAESGVTPVGGLAAEAVVARVVGGKESSRTRELENSREGEESSRVEEGGDRVPCGNDRRAWLGRFAAVADAPGFARAAARTIGEIRMAGIAVEEIAEQDRELGSILRAYEAEMEAAGLTDRAGVFRRACEVARDPSHAAALLGLPVVMVDVPVRWAQECDLLRAVIERAPEVVVTVAGGDEVSLGLLGGVGEFEFVDLDARGERFEGDRGDSTSAARRVDSRAGDGSGKVGPADPPPPPRRGEGLSAAGAAERAREQTSDAFVAAEDARAGAALGRLQRNLFGDETPEVVEADESVVVLSAPGESRECVEIARQIMMAAREDVPFDQMAILLRSPNEYRPHLEEALNRAQIAAHFARGVMRPDPAGRAFLALLRCASEGLSARRFAEYLSLGEVPGTDEAGRPPGEVARGDRFVAPEEDGVAGVLRIAGVDQSGVPDANEESDTREVGTSVDVRPGPRPAASELSRRSPLATAGSDPAWGDEDVRDEAWEERNTLDPPANPPRRRGALRAPRKWERLLVDAAVIGGIDRWERRLEGLEHELQLDLEASDDPDDPARERITRDIDNLRALRIYALPLLEDLQVLPDEATWGEWLDRLTALATRSLRDPERVLATLAELEPMGPIGPVDIHEVHRVLARHLLELRQKISKSRYGRVFIGSIDEARGMSFEIVFVPGMAEKLFPRKIVEDPVLLDVVRARLSSQRSVASSQRGEESGVRGQESEKAAQTLSHGTVSPRCISRDERASTPGSRQSAGTPAARLPKRDDRIAEERLLLRLAVGAARRRVILSYPRLDLDQSRPRVPSFYALETFRAAEGHLPRFDELATRAETVTSTRVGWPAPRDRMDAIDEAEYDLAVLEDLIDKDPEQTLGTAHYLLTANPHLARALRFRARRWLRRWTPADGLVEPDREALEAIKQHHPDRRAFSPTALQNFATCPYKFLLYTVHKLSPREEAEAIEGMDPLQRGSLVHEVLFELLTELQAAKLLPVRKDTMDEAREMLDATLDAVAARYRDDLAPAIDRVWNDGIDSIRADLREWLRRSSEDDSGFLPWRFELSFGLPARRPHDPHSVSDPVELECGISLRGSIDVVEHDGSGHLRVTDYKTGKTIVPEQTIIHGGKALQPVFYALAAERIFDEQRVVSGRLYYCTAAGGFEEREVELNQAARQAAARVALTIKGAIESGFLPAAPDEGACTWCDYNCVCGHAEERRVKRKPSDRLTELRELRNEP